MNSLLSLSFLNPGPAVTSAGSAMSDAAETTANADSSDASAGSDDFGRLLNQSGQRQDTERQSFAGFNLVGKTKLTTTALKDQAETGAIALLPDVLSDAELTDADEHHAITLLGVLQQAGITTKQLAALAEKHSKSGQTEVADVPASDKVAKDQWFILPVDPEPAETSKADGTLLVIDTEVVADDKAVLNAAEAGTKAAKTLLTADNEALLNAENADAETLAGAAADKNGHVANPAAAVVDSATKLAQGVAQQVSDADDKQPALAGNTADPGLPADGQTAAASPALQALAAADEAATQSDLTPGAIEKSIVAATVMVSGNAASADAKVVAADSTEPARFNKFASQTAQAATIFDSATPAAKADVASVAANAAGAAVLSESALAKQQLKTGLADAGAAAKTPDTAESETSGKTDNTAAATGQRLETTTGGFSNMLSGAANTGPAETAAARLEATNITGAQQLAEQTKTQRAKPTAAEQLKQVNLLEQNASGQLKERINLMVRQNIQVAEIRLDPAELGQMQIRVNLQQEQASVQFIVQQQHAKELLEQQMPRLREMLQQQGIQLGEGQVQQQRQGESQANSQRGGEKDNGQPGQQTAEEQATAVTLDVKLSERIVDFYA